MNLLKLLICIKFISLTIIFSNCYKFICQYHLRFFKKRCYLLLSVTETSYKSIFLSTIPKDLKSRLQQYTVVDRFQSIGLLTSSNSLISGRLTKENLRCVAIAFNYKPKKLAGVWIFQNEVAVKNYNKKYLVDDYGKPIKQENSAYLKRKLSLYNTFNKNKKSFMRRSSCPIS